MKVTTLVTEYYEEIGLIGCVISKYANEHEQGAHSGVCLTFHFLARHNIRVGRWVFYFSCQAALQWKYITSNSATYTWFCKYVSPWMAIKWPSSTLLAAANDQQSTADHSCLVVFFSGRVSTIGHLNKIFLVDSPSRSYIHPTSPL